MNWTDENIALARRFHAALAARDWLAIRALLHDDAYWVLPGNNRISGPADGAGAVVERAKLIASYGLKFKLLRSRKRRSSRNNRLGILAVVAGRVSNTAWIFIGV